MSENAFVFPDAPRSRIVGLLNELATGSPLIVWLVDEPGGLYQDWDHEDVANLAQAVGHRPGWGVQINYRLSRRTHLVALACALLESGGVAVDDFCVHAWTVAELQSDVLFKGARFGEGPVR